ncbi:MAG TPA: xanthine dehydrogenase family protein subunit M [Thermodesulfovibrionales bacterium]|jgi:xanthine dehydrogenase YagS FAD-binding subunit|nr:xanthine dehydrogenase family protein subunit M [Thermodesulfovibrionales bacterium]
MMPEFAYVRARSLREALSELSSDGARVHAGGTDLLGCLRDGVFSATKVVSMSGLSELRGIEETAGGVRIGALVTLSELADNPLIKGRYPALSQGASEAASPQLRNQGTVAGNLCQKPRCWYYRGEFNCLRKGGDRCFAVAGENHYHAILGGERCYIVHPSDTAPALVAYGAVVHTAGSKGKREIPAEKFFVLPAHDVTRETVLESGEIVTEIVLSSPTQGVRSSYHKVRARQSWDFALAGVALVLQLKGEIVGDAKIVLTGAAPVPWRSFEAEEAVTGKVLNEDVARKAASAAVRRARPLEHNGYKIPLFRGLIEEALIALTRS